MTANNVSFVQEVFQSPFVEEALCVDWLGGSKNDPEVIARYLNLPVRTRPEISCFFDREFYLQAYPDIVDAAIDPLVHFISCGISEERTPHPLIDISHIRSLGVRLFPHPMTIDALWAALCHDLIDPSSRFSLEFYRSQIVGVKVPDGGLLKHFLQAGILQGLRPVPSFDPISFYSQSDQKSFDLRSALRLFAATDASGRQDAVTKVAHTTKYDMLTGIRTDVNQAVCAKTPLRFDSLLSPDITVIIPLSNHFALTLQTLASLRSNYAGPMELILMDCGSLDETRNLSRYVTGARLLAFDTNVSPAHCFNAGIGMATANAILFLDSTIELGQGTIAAALGQLATDPKIGAVGAKVIDPHGRLQEAGCIVWRDGRTSGCLRGQSPLLPEANFVRDVDFCSMTWLMARTELLRNSGGIDTGLSETDFQAADLCLRLQAMEYRIVYDPSVVVYRLSSSLHQANTPDDQRISPMHQVFLEKHRDRLKRARLSGHGNELCVPSADNIKGRVLLIEDHLPLRRLGSGFVRSNDIIRIMSALGYHITAYPIHPNTQDLAAIYSDFPATVEIVHDRSIRHLEEFLQARTGFFDTIWIARSHNLNLVRPILERTLKHDGQDPQIVLDTEAIEATRDELRHRISQPDAAFNLQQSLRTELRNADFCRTIIAVNRQEAQIIQELGFSNVKIIGHTRAVTLTSRPWTERVGMLFLGAIHTQDSPNLDSLQWFVETVLPLIEAELGYDTRLTIAGYTANSINLIRFRHHPRITVYGPVTDPALLYNAARVFVAPTRYAAGIPYKIHEAASFGLPVVATELLRRQLGWENGKDLLAADASDPASFARHVVTLYRSETTWQLIRHSAAQRIQTECACDTVQHVIAEILQ